MKALDHCSKENAAKIKSIIDDVIFDYLPDHGVDIRRRLRNAIIQTLDKNRFCIAYGIFVTRELDSPSYD